MATGIGLLGATIIAPPMPRLLWNASASAPLGLYVVSPSLPAGRSETVIAWAPEPYRSLAAARHYLPRNVPLVKRVAAVPGAQVCALGAAIFVDGKWVADRLRHDGRGRRMPWWNGCRTVQAGQRFLLMDSAPGSFDGRYFGISDAPNIVGKAHLLWAW